MRCFQTTESVVQGMSLIEQLDEEVYYGLFCVLEDDGKVEVEGRIGM